MNDCRANRAPRKKELAHVVVLFSAFSLGIAGQLPLGRNNDVTLPSAIKFAAEDHSL
jgi:hypothetical protein